MHDWSSLSHVRWECKYHVVIVPKYRKKKLYGKFRVRVGTILRELCRQKGVDLMEGHLMADNIHMCLSVPPKYSIAFVIGFLKGKSAVRIHREILNHRITGLHFWSRGYCVSTMGLDEEVVRRYIRDQESVEKKQLELELKLVDQPHRGFPNVPSLPPGGYLMPPAMRVETQSNIKNLVLRTRSQFSGFAI